MTLQEFFHNNPRAALAFSGGADSAYLLWAAREWAEDVKAYYVHSPFQPAFELADARRLAEELHMPMTVLEADVLSVPGAAANGPDRCYHCKKRLFTALARAAAEDGLVAGGLHVPAGEEPAHPQEGVEPVDRKGQKGQHLDDMVSTADVGALMEQDIPPGVPAQAQGEVDFGREEAQHKGGVHPVALPGAVRGADGGGQPPPQAQPGHQAPQPQRQHAQNPDDGQHGQYGQHG